MVFLCKKQYRLLFWKWKFGWSKYILVSQIQLLLMGGRGPEIQDGGHETRENNKKHCDFHLYHTNQLIKIIKIFASEMFPIKWYFVHLRAIGFKNPLEIILSILFFNFFLRFTVFSFLLFWPTLDNFSSTLLGEMSSFDLLAVGTHAADVRLIR